MMSITKAHARALKIADIVERSRLNPRGWMHLENRYNGPTLIEAVNVGFRSKQQVLSKNDLLSKTKLLLQVVVPDVNINGSSSIGGAGEYHYYFDRLYYNPQDPLELLLLISMGIV